MGSLKKIPDIPVSRIYVLSGRVQGGKTTYLSKLLDPLREDGLKITGFLCKGYFKDGERAGFTLFDLKNGLQIPFAAVDERPGWFKFRRFYFNAEAFAAGESWIRSGMVHQPDLVIIDEVGPMEIEKNGWWNILNYLEKNYEGIQLWVVREQILPAIMEQWNIPDSNIFSIDNSDPFQLVEHLLTEYKKLN